MPPVVGWWNSPFEADASIASSELRESVLTSVLWPGMSREYRRADSGGFSFDLVYLGMSYTSMALLDKATKSCER